MPHFVVERTTGGDAEPNVPALLAEIHKAAAATGIFDEKTIKVRVREYDEALVAGEPASFIHVTIYLIDGRDKPTKKRLASAIHDCLRHLCPDAVSVSVDVRDLDREIYTKSQL